MQTVDGFKTRTPFESAVDLNLSYKIKISGIQNLTVLVNIFNLFNEQKVTGYNYFTENSFAVPNPDGPAANGVLNATGAARTSYQLPRQVAFGLRYAF